jgi:hypothetical protein
VTGKQMQDMIYFHIAATENDAASYGTHGISQTVNEFETNLMTFLFFFFLFLYSDTRTRVCKQSAV